MACDKSEATLLGLPTELTVMIGELLVSAKDLCNLRATCYDMALRLYRVIGPRISLQLTFDPVGLETIEALTKNRSSPRLLPMVNYISRVRLPDLAIYALANLFYRDRNTSIEQLKQMQSSSQLTRQQSDTESITYEGYEQLYDDADDNAMYMYDVATKLSPKIRELDIWRLAKALEKLPKLTSIGSYLHRVDLDVLFNHGKGYRLAFPNSICHDTDWVGAADPPSKDPGSRKYIVRRYTSTFSADSIDAYEDCCTRPAFLEFIRLDKHFQPHFKMSKMLQRLTITSWSIRLHEQSERSNDASVNAAVDLIGSCENVSRLRVIFGEDWGPFALALRTHNLVHVLADGNLPKLTHLRIDGGCFEGEDAYNLLRYRRKGLKFFFFNPCWFAFHNVNQDCLSPFMNICKMIEYAYIDFDSYGFEQFVAGKGLENVDKRTAWRLGFNATGMANGPLRSGSGRQRSGRRYGSALSEEDAESHEEAQSAEDVRQEFRDFFESVAFD